MKAVLLFTKVSKGLQKGGTVIFGFALVIKRRGDGVGVSERSERGEGLAKALPLLCSCEL